MQYANDALTTDQDIYENLTLQGAQLTEKLQTLRGKIANPTVSPDDLSKSINQLNNALSNVDQLQKQSAALSLELHEANWQLERIDKLKSDQEFLLIMGFLFLFHEQLHALGVSFINQLHHKEKVD